MNDANLVHQDNERFVAVAPSHNSIKRALSIIGIIVLLTIIGLLAYPKTRSALRQLISQKTLPGQSNNSTLNTQHPSVATASGIKTPVPNELTTTNVVTGTVTTASPTSITLMADGKSTSYTTDNKTRMLTTSTTASGSAIAISTAFTPVSVQIGTTVKLTLATDANKAIHVAIVQVIK